MWHFEPGARQDLVRVENSIVFFDQYHKPKELQILRNCGNGLVEDELDHSSVSTGRDASH